MSHISKIEVEIQSLEDLKAACKELGFQFCEGQKTHLWYGTNKGSENNIDSDFGKCDHAIKVPKCKFIRRCIRKSPFSKRTSPLNIFTAD